MKNVYGYGDIYAVYHYQAIILRRLNTENDTLTYTHSHPNEANTFYIGFSLLLFYYYSSTVYYYKWNINDNFLNLVNIL